MEFSGFTDRQFAVFEIPTFAERMTAIRSQVRPQLVALGEALAPALSDLVRHPLYPHVAMHARRKVNPPDDTWVAFGRSARGYKAYAHFEVGVLAEGMYVGLVLKDEAEDKAALGAQILANPQKSLRAFRRLKGFELRELKGIPLSKLKEEDVSKLGTALIHRKTSSLHLLRFVAALEPRVHSAEGVQELAVELATPLVPLYKMATSVRRSSTIRTDP